MLTERNPRRRRAKAGSKRWLREPPKKTSCGDPSRLRTIRLALNRSSVLTMSRGGYGGPETVAATPGVGEAGAARPTPPNAPSAATATSATSDRGACLAAESRTVSGSPRVMADPRRTPARLGDRHGSRPIIPHVGRDRSGPARAARSATRRRRERQLLTAPVRSLGRGSLTLAAHRGEALLEAGLLEDRLHFLHHVVRRVEVAEAELLASLEQVLHVIRPLLTPRLADGGEHEVRIAAHALVVEGGAPFGERFNVPACLAALDLHAAHDLIDHRDAVVARAAALAGVAVVAVPERIVGEQACVAVERAPRDLARRVLGEARRRAARRADATLDAALEAVLVVVHARVVEDAVDELLAALGRLAEGVVGDDRVGVDGRLGRLAVVVSHRMQPPGSARRRGRTRARNGRERRA